MIRDTIYKMLATDPSLASMLAEKPAELGGGPAIYEKWAAPDSDMPYINLTYAFGPSEGLFKREGSLDVDIFVQGNDSIQIERIANQIINILDIEQPRDPDDGPFRIYLDSESDIPEDDETVIHWNLTFSLYTWRVRFISDFIRR